MGEPRVYRLGADRPRLWGRDRGREVRAEIERLLDRLGPGEALAVDLKAVEVMDFSFANEVFGKLYGRIGSEYPGRVLLLTGLADEFVKENLAAALAALNLMAVAYKSPRRWELLGKFADTDRETLEALQRLKVATAPQLAEALGIQLTAVNQRLKKLSDTGLIARTRVSAPTGGGQYVYRWPG